MILAHRLKHNILLQILFGLIVQLFSTPFTTAETIKKSAEVAVPVQLLEIKVVPRIRLTEVNSLKSYVWWNNAPENENLGTEAKNGSTEIKTNSLKIPIAFKTLLKKMKEDFLKENIDVKFYLSQVNSKNVGEYENYYLITGNLIIDSKNKERADLTELSFYQIKKSALEMLFLSQTATFTSESSFRGLALEFNDKINDKVYEKPDFNTTEFLIIFENELNYEELSQIRLGIQEGLSIDINQIKLYSSETNKYTFKLFVTQNPYDKIKSLNFVNGPYKTEIKDRQITFKTFSDEEILEP